MLVIGFKIDKQKLWYRHVGEALILIGDSSQDHPSAEMDTMSYSSKKESSQDFFDHN